MLVRPHLPGYRWFHIFRNAAIRTGVYVGVCLTLVFTVWLLIANHAPFLERFALERNIAAAAILCFLAAVPVYKEEMALKISDGAERLEELFGECGITELVDAKRVNAVAERKLPEQ